MAVDTSMSVLVVDDYNTMIRIIRNLLKQLGFENIDDASDGSAALNKMRGKKYGLVLDVGGYYKNVFTLAPSFIMTHEEFDLAIDLLDQLFRRCSN